MAEFQSIPHVINAFRFKDASVKPPQWFKDAHGRGEIQITISEKYGNYICVYSENQMEKAVFGDWVCQHPNGKIFILDDHRFRGSYKKFIEKNKRCSETLDLEDLIDGRG